jgi:hypothetical protein
MRVVPSPQSAPPPILVPRIVTLRLLAWSTHCRIKHLSLEFPFRPERVHPDHTCCVRNQGCLHQGVAAKPRSFPSVEFLALVNWPGSSGAWTPCCMCLLPIVRLGLVRSGFGDLGCAFGPFSPALGPPVGTQPLGELRTGYPQAQLCRPALADASSQAGMMACEGRQTCWGCVLESDLWGPPTLRDVAVISQGQWWWPQQGDGVSEL